MKFVILFYRFVWVSDCFKPKDNGEESQVSIFCKFRKKI